LTILVFLCCFNVEASVVFHSVGFVKLRNDNFVSMGTISVRTFVCFLRLSDSFL
jgi:hypothetical protein